MRSSFKKIAPLVCTLFAWSLIPVQARAGVIVGMDDSFGNLGVLYAVDPMTGNTTSLNRIPMGSPISSTPWPYTFFTMDVNLYSNNLLTGYSVEYGCMDKPGCNWGPSDLAYDSNRGSFFAMGPTDYNGGHQALFRMVDKGWAFERYELVEYQWIGEFGSEYIWAMEYIPGLGLYGVGGNHGYLIDEATGHATLLATLSTAPITGLAYDADSGRLIGTTGRRGWGLPGSIYQIDPTTGASTLLNDHAPNLLGIAAVDIPEPGVITMVALGLAFCIVAWHSTRISGVSMPSEGPPPA